MGGVNRVQIMRIGQALFLLILLCVPVYAQEDDAEEPVVITVGNVADLQSVVQIDFADGFTTPVLPPLDGSEPDEDLSGDLLNGEFQTGWFIMNEPGDLFGVLTAENALWIVNEDAVQRFAIEAPLIEDNLYAPLVDASFSSHGTSLPVFAVYGGEAQFSVMVQDGQIYGNPVVSMEVASAYDPLSLWVDCPTDNYLDCSPWIEAADAQSSVIMRVFSQNELYNFFSDSSVPELAEFEDDTLFMEGSYGPGSDNELIRIGRIESPLVVTSAEDGTVTRWDLQTGDITAEVQVQNGPVVFGQLNVDGRYLAWRDPMSTALYLLDFETGENRQIAELNGDYAQFFLVTPDADLIFAVHLNDDPLVVAWNTATGERYDLGEYRQCGRELDMARLSVDGTTLVIGCDTGLDIWRVAN